MEFTTKEKIRKLKEDLNLSVTNLAKELEVSRSYICNVLYYSYEGQEFEGFKLTYNVKRIAKKNKLNSRDYVLKRE